MTFVRLHVTKCKDQNLHKRQGKLFSWAEASIKIARMTLTIKLDRNWSSFQLANSAPPLSVTDGAIAPSARMAASVGRFARCKYFCNDAVSQEL